jgi:predicted TIM-barrel fold metal-dependent hydrolase
LMDELGVDRALMFPTLASLVEERMKDDVELTHVVVHALNEWMYETWSFNYEERIFATPVVTLPIVDKAIEELEWCLERGARTVLIRPAPVPGFRGSRSPGLPEFDPFWERIVQAGIPVSMHASDSGYAEFLNVWEGSSEFLPFRPTTFRMVAGGKRPVEDTMAALVCHGALSRFPELRILSIENGAGWAAHLIDSFADVYSKMPGEFPEDPVKAFTRNVYLNPFWEDNLKGIVDLVGDDHVLFGSDYPHPEGLADPLSYIDELEGLSDESIRKIMGGNLANLMGVGASV